MQGSIPSAVNIPLSTIEKAMALDEGDFTREYGFNKPSKDQALIVYCRKGQRSETAQNFLKGKGFKK